MSTLEIIEQIIEHARWAPSGDNSQPWRFEIISPWHVVVHGLDKRDFYDLDGHSQQISVGAMLETFVIAATHWKLRVQITRREDSSDFRPKFDLHLTSDDSMGEDSLFGVIKKRTVQRLPLFKTPLSETALAALGQSVGPGYSVVWKSSRVERRQMAQMLYFSAKIRLISPEAFSVHKGMIKLECSHSEVGIPDQALGARFLLPAVQYSMRGGWERTQLINSLSGTQFPRLVMDYWPAIACAGHFAIVAPHPPRAFDDRIEAGRRMQRFWLTVTQQGLYMQPAITPLVFARYAREGRSFSVQPKVAGMAQEVGARLDRELAPELAARAVFMGRVGEGNEPTSRSTRLPVKALLELPVGQAGS